jgi:hypothetical protein
MKAAAADGGAGEEVATGFIAQLGPEHPRAKTAVQNLATIWGKLHHNIIL